MSGRKNRLETLRMIISNKELCCQEEVLDALHAEGFKVTQATLSRDLKQLKVAKAATMDGKYVYVLPNITMYKRVSTPQQIKEMMRMPGFLSITFSGSIGVIKTRPGYAASIAYNIDEANIPCILGTIAGDDTILIVITEGTMERDVVSALSTVMPDIK